MITIITGVPGAGKTLYAVSKLVAPLVGTTIEAKNAAGELVTYPRTIYTNINGLLLDHELIDGGTNHGLQNWHEWAKPGSVIVFDEFQKVWAPKPNGAAIPPDIQALDTHRHMGVDFILITQSVMNTHKHIHALCGRHLHVRRVANMKMAIVYEWDHASRTLAFPKAITKTPWRYDKNVFKLYKSAELHTKQPRKLPGVVWFLLIALVMAGIFGPATYQNMKRRFGEAKPEEVALSKPSTGAKKPLPSDAKGSADSGSGSKPLAVDDMKGWTPRVVDKPETAPNYDALRVVNSMPTIKGSMCINDRCKCYTEQGTEAAVSESACIDFIAKKPHDPYKGSASRDAPAARALPST